MKSKELLVGIVMCSLYLSCSASAYPQNQLGTTVAVKTPEASMSISYLTTAENHIPIDVNVNGKMSGRFLFDSGTNVCYIGRNEVKKLGLPDHPLTNSDGSPRLGLLDNKPEQWLGIPYIVIGGTVLTNVLFLEADDKAIARYAHSDEKGVIGSSLLYKASVLIDYPFHKILFLDHTSLSQTEISDLRMSDSPYIEINQDNSYIITTILQLTNNNVQVATPFLVDSGDYITVLLSKVAKPLNLQGRFQEKQSNQFDGAMTNTFVTVSQINSGTFTLNNQGLYVGNPSATNNLSILGTDILSNYRVLIDTGAKRMYLDQKTQSPIKIHIKGQ